MPSEIILYDLPSKGDNPRSWSLNTWKARLALNYKGLPYQTEWVEYPDIANKMQSLVPKNDVNGTTAFTDYSMPAAKLPDGSYVMDSFKIAQALEKLQPEPSMHLDSKYFEPVQKAVLGCRGQLGPICMPRVPGIVPPRSAEYFEKTRAERFGMPLSELAKSDKAGENAWKNVDPSLQELKAILHENEDGPYVLGKEASFSDFMIVGFWEFAKSVDENGDLFERGMKYDSSFRRHYEACEQWLQRGN